MNGLLELVSAPLVRYIATSHEIRHFVQRAEQGILKRSAAGWAVSTKGALAKGDAGPRVWNRQEDMVLGFWLSRGERQGKFKITWVRINDRSNNMGCLSTKGMYQRPRNDTVSVHFLKGRGGLDYLYGLLHDGVPHSGENCSRWVWYDNCRDLASARRNVKEWCAANCGSKPCTNALNPNFVTKPRRAEDRKTNTKPSRSKMRKDDIKRFKG